MSLACIISYSLSAYKCSLAELLHGVHQLRCTGSLLAYKMIKQTSGVHYQHFPSKTANVHVPNENYKSINYMANIQLQKPREVV